MELKVFEIITRNINERITDVANSLCDGVAKDYAEYKGLCGTIHGLRSAQFEVNDLLRKIKEDDDE